MKSLENQPLGVFNTFRINHSSRWLTVIEDSSELALFFDDIRFKGLEILVLGGGSNILFTRDFNGVILVMANKGVSISSKNNAEVIIEAAAGENWHELVTWSIQNGLGGIENLSLIPGCVGAAPIQNIGAYGVELKDVFHSLVAYEIESGKTRTFSKEDCQFGYRNSVFKGKEKGKFIILSVKLRLSLEPVLHTDYGDIMNELALIGKEQFTITDVSEAVIRIRQRKLPDPKVLGNAGSFFKNPVLSLNKFEALKVLFPEIRSYPAEDGMVKVPAGWLIEHAGWKGKRMGNCGVHMKQALVLVNYGNAKGNEILELSERIQDSVYEKYGIKLEREVTLV